MAVNFILFTPLLALSSIAKNMSRYDSALLNRLRVGHSRLNHSLLLCGDDTDDPQPVNLVEFHLQ